MYTLSEINIYPIKSLGGIGLQTAEVEERGLKFDRRWMLVENENKFITQREHPQMALLQVAIEEAGLSIKHKIKNTEKLFIPFNYVHPETRDVIIWNDLVSGSFYDQSIDEWFSDILNVKCRLVHMPDSTIRKVNPERAKNKIVSFADGYPFLIIGQASLKDLNSRLAEHLPMNRFRPNLVFTGGKPYEEDRWKNFKIGGAKFRAVKPSVRCVITTTNQETGDRTHEPLLTLSKYRKINNGVIFGMNLVCESTGKIKLGNNIEPIKTNFLNSFRRK